MSDVFDTTLSFKDLGLRNSLLKGLDDAGFEHPTHIQSKLIPPMLDGRDLLGQAKTGTGKTAAFALPILNHADKDTPVQALILAPTRELAIQIVSEIDELARHTPIRAAAVTGGASFKKQRDAIEGGTQIIVGTPGRIMDLHGRRTLSFGNLRWVVLDEVDRMLDIGFRDDIRKILSQVRTEHQTVFVSATISDEIERLGRRFMKDDADKIITVAKSLTVSQVTQHYVPVERRRKKDLLVKLLNEEEPALTVVFCRMKVTVDEVARHLKANDIDAFAIHGDLGQGRRNRIMERLRAGKLEVLVASDLASRGLDVQGITHIINYDLPEDPEVYVHRIGRTARAGHSGVAWAFVEPTEGQRLTEVEKLTGVLIDQLDYPEFRPQREPERTEPVRPPSRAGAVYADDDDQPAAIDTSKFPGGVAPKGLPRKTVGSRLRSRRRR